MESCGRPSRSDEHLSREEEKRVEDETRGFFDSMAPRRHSKPQRSDYSSVYSDSFAEKNNGHCDDDDGVIPEYARFQRLENDSQKFIRNEGQVEEEFVETEYYRDLNCIDKQHHTTGTGFIEVEETNGKSFGFSPDFPTASHAASTGNPATNDWIPAAPDTESFASDKPNRSEN